MTHLEWLRKLSQDSVLSPVERAAICWAIEQVNELSYSKKMESWKNPYTEAISLLERAARAHEGGYG